MGLTGEIVPGAKWQFIYTLFILRTQSWTGAALSALEVTFPLELSLAQKLWGLGAWSFGVSSVPWGSWLQLLVSSPRRHSNCLQGIQLLKQPS